MTKNGVYSKQIQIKKFLIGTIFFVLLIGNVHVFAEPFMTEPNFLIEKYVSGLSWPTKMAFMDDEILILEKFGNVRLVKDGKLQSEPLLELKVYNNQETGLLGITTLDSTIYLYFTEVKTDDEIVLGNRIYKFNWERGNLLDGVLVKELPYDTSKRSLHSGGAMVTGLDGTVFAVIGDTNRRGPLQNLENGNFDDTGVILKVNHDESILKPSQDENPQDHYYAMGIRNSFGLAIDPFTGNLWDTENGATFFDEINLVIPGFNSGWIRIMGPSTENQVKNLPTNGFKYSDPEFSWEQVIAPTGLVFVNSELFNDYNDSLLVGDFNTGSISRFKLNSERTGFVFDDPGLKDLILNQGDIYNEIIFASGFNGISDLQFGPDGLLYVLSILDGTVYRIVPTTGSMEFSEIFLPDWIKNNAGWWADGSISDMDFVLAIQYLINEGIMTIPPSSTGITHSQEIPDWIKNNAGWWADGSISDMDFVSGIQHLITNGVIKVKDSCESSLRMGKNFSGCNLVGMDFSNSNLNLVNFNKTNLRNANLSNSELMLTQFNQANLIDTDFSKSNLQMVNFKDADLSNSKFTKARLKFVEMSGATLEGAQFSGSIISKSFLKNVNLNNVNLSQANLVRSNLENALITGADLSNTNLFSTNFENANLSYSNMTNADLRWGNLVNANFHGADLKHANFFHANLKNTDFTETILTNVNFTETNLENAKGAPFVGCIGHSSCTLE